MKLGVIGAGAWGVNIVRTLEELGSLGCVADSDPRLLERAASISPSGATFASYKDLLETDVPAVCIATPAHTHFQIALDAMQAGKDVFVEKPLTLSLSDAKELVELAERSGRVLMVDHLLLFQPAITWIKKALADGMIGDVYSIHAERLKFGRVRSNENALWSLGVHDVAVILFLAGQMDEPEIVSCSQRALQPGIEDDYFLHLKFASGLQAHLHTSWLWPELKRGLVIVGSTGMLSFDEVSQTVTHHRKRVNTELECIVDGQEVVFNEKGPPLTTALTHFMECVSSRNKPLTTGETAIPVVALMERVGV